MGTNRVIWAGEWDRSACRCFFIIVTYFFLYVKIVADWLIKFVQANFQARYKPYGGGTDRPWRGGREEWSIQFSGEYGAIWGSLEVAEKSHMGVPIGNSGRFAHERPGFPHLYYTTGRRKCQYLFEKKFLNKKSGRFLYPTITNLRLEGCSLLPYCFFTCSTVSLSQ